MIKKTILSLALAALTAVAANARTINIFGKVTFTNDNKPAFGVNVRDFSSNKILATTDDEGNFIITADSEGTLVFENGGLTIQDLMVDIDERMQLNVSVLRAKRMLNEVEVTGTIQKKAFVIEDADLEVDGNMLKIKQYRVKIPQKMFDADKRITIQPAIYNITRDHVTYLNPVVVDGWRYAITQERMDDWNLAVDPLTQIPNYYVKSGEALKDNVVYIRDSVYLDNPSDDVIAVIRPMIEDYNRVLYADSFEIARGTVNPFRFLQFKLDPVELTDTRYVPNDIPEPRDTEGEMNLMFEVGKSKLNPELGINGQELDALLDQFKKIENDPNSTLKGFSIFGYASPEGNPETNDRLAKERMESALSWINASYHFPKKVTPVAEAEVAPWSDVIDMLRADSLFEEADMVQLVLDTYKSPEGRMVAMSRLPFYKTLLATKYLPRLRRVSYTIKTEYYRPLTDAEIEEIYKQDPSQLAKHHYYRYYTSRQGKEREEILRNAVKTYPGNFVAAATDLSKIMLENGEDPTELLAPYFADHSQWRILPASTRHNYGLAALNNMKYSLADSLFSTINDDRPQIHKAKVYSRVIQGDFSANIIDEVGKDSHLNRVLILLKQKRNNLAWQAAQQLGNSAVEEYVKAIAAHRLEDFSDYDHLELALRKDPSLLDIAKVDGDVVDMLENLDIDDILANPIIETTDITSENNENSQQTTHEND